MNLLELTHPELVFINPPCRTPEALIRWLSEPLVGRNVITDKDAFIQSVLHRESEGPTALGEALAVPHGKSDAVQQAAFCLALLMSRLSGRGWKAMKRSGWFFCSPSRTPRPAVRICSC